MRIGRGVRVTDNLTPSSFPMPSLSFHRPTQSSRNINSSSLYPSVFSGLFMPSIHQTSNGLLAFYCRILFVNGCFNIVDQSHSICLVIEYSLVCTGQDMHLMRIQQNVLYESKWYSSRFCLVRVSYDCGKHLS